MWVVVVPAVGAGLLGVLASRADAAADYVPRIRLALLASVLLGWLGVAIFSVHKARGAMRWLAPLLGLLAVRVCYVPILAGALVVTGWLDRLARALGAGNLDGPVHYALTCLTAAFAALVALRLVHAATEPKRLGSIATLCLYAAVAIAAFVHPDDRRALPHPLVEKDLPRANGGPTYAAVATSGDYRARTRMFALFGAARHVASPREGWAGAVRAELLARFRANPDLSLAERATALDAALVTSRPWLRTSPRTPPE